MSDRPNTIQTGVVIAPYTTMKVGGPADYLSLPTTIDALVTAWEWARHEKIPVTMIGAGSNSLVNDAGIRGLVIIPRNSQLVWTPPRVIVGAGVKNGQLIGAGANHGLGGLSWLLGVPGTVGGSLYGNAGSKEHGLGDYVVWVEIIDDTGQRRKLNREECHFAYRHSIFKELKACILQAELELPTVDPVQERTLLAAMAKDKNAKQPTTAASAGCMFKNPVVMKDTLPKELQPFIMDNHTISAWRLIEYLNLKGKQIGQVQISNLHGNFMINLGGATADQIVQLISFVKQQVRDTLGIQLQEEVQYLGF